MATGIYSASVDIDSLFLARVNTKRANVGWFSNGGVDISNRFEPIGAGAPRPATGLYSAGTDLANLFRNINQPLGVTVNAGADIDTTANPTASRTATASGGTAPYSFAWTRISGDSRITATTPSAATTTFSRTGFALGERASATFRCTATATAGGSGFDDVVVTLERPS